MTVTDRCRIRFPTRWLKFAAAILAFAGFGISQPADAITIYFFQRGYVAGGRGASTRLTDEAVARFESNNPEIDVIVVGLPWTQEGDLKLRAALLHRERIDCFRLAHDQLDDFMPGRGSLLSPADEYLSDRDIADISPGALEAVRRDGRVMAWPLWSTAAAILANTEIAEARGIDLPSPETPWTWDAMLEALRKSTFVNENGTHVWGLTVAARPPLFEWSPLLWTHSGPIFDKERSSDESLRFVPGVAEGLRRIAELRELGVVPPSFGTDDQYTAQQQFRAGKAAFILTSPGFIRSLAGGDIHYKILAPPIGAYGRPITTGALGCFAVVAHPEDKERERASHALGHYLTSAEIADDVPGWYLAPPVRESVESFRKDPAYEGLAPIVRTSVYMDAPGDASFLDRMLQNFQGAILGEVEPETAIENTIRAYERRGLK